MNKKIKLICLILFTILSFSVTGLTLVIYSGYKIDFKNFRLIKTGSLYINTNPGKTEIYINNEKFSQKTPTIINQLNPGVYSVRLIKEGYKEWEQTIEIIPSITSFINYDLVLKDIELSPANEFGENIHYSNDNRYISYVRHDNETSVNNIYIYDVLEKNEVMVYSTEKKIEKVSWSKKNSKLLIEMDEKFFILDINIIPIINKISSDGLINLNNFIKNIDNVFWNEEDDYKTIIKSGEKIYSFNIQTNEVRMISDSFKENNLIYINNTIYYTKNSLVVEEGLSNESIFTYNNLNINNVKDIKYINENFILETYNNILYVFKNFKNKEIKVSGENIKIDKNYIISWDDHEFNVYDKKEKIVKFTTRYSQKILDIDFYSKNYAILILEKDIKLINIGDNVNELDIISNKNNITKVMSFDNKSVFVIYEKDNKNIISNLSLQ